MQLQWIQRSFQILDTYCQSKLPTFTCQSQDDGSSHKLPQITARVQIEMPWSEPMLRHASTCGSLLSCIMSKSREVDISSTSIQGTQRHGSSSACNDCRICTMLTCPRRPMSIRGRCVQWSRTWATSQEAVWIHVQFGGDTPCAVSYMQRPQWRVHGT